MRDRWLQALVYGGWTIGVPALADGMWLESPALVALAAWALFAAVAAGAVDNVCVVAHAGRQDRTLSREAA